MNGSRGQFNFLFQLPNEFLCHNFTNHSKRFHSYLYNFQVCIHCNVPKKVQKLILNTANSIINKYPHYRNVGRRESERKKRL